MQKIVSKHAQQEIEIIQKLTGAKRLRYFDQAYMTEVVKQVLLGRNPNNIQMLTCFSLKNCLNGVLLLMKDYFGEKPRIHTITLNTDTNSLVSKHQTTVDEFIQGVSSIQPNQAMILELSFESGSVIYLDLFGRQSKPNSLAVQTLTEVGHSAF